MDLNKLVVPTLLSIVLLLIPSYVYLGQGQTTTITSITTRQCIDFNQDRICEFILLANGTMMKNPGVSGQPMTETTSKKTQTTDFPSYRNHSLGITIQYPVGWQLEVDKNKITFVQQNDIVSLETNVENNIEASLSEYVNTRLKELLEQRQDFNLLESTPATISGNPAHKVVYTFVKEDGLRAGEINKVLRIWSIENNKLYTIAYVAEEDRFSEYLPKIEKAIDSFRINALTTPASTR